MIERIHIFPCGFFENRLIFIYIRIGRINKRFVIGISLHPSFTPNPPAHARYHSTLSAVD